MKSRRFSLQETHDGLSVLDEGAFPWAVVPRGVGDPHACGETLLAIARKVYASGLADAYAGTSRGFVVRKGDDGEGARTWDLVGIGKETRRVGSLPRRRFAPFGDPAKGVLERLSASLHAAAMADGRKGAGGAGEAFL
jgi:hypothetical protein